MAPDEMEVPTTGTVDFDHDVAVAAILARIDECAKPGSMPVAPLPPGVGPVIEFLEEQFCPDWYEGRGEAVWLEIQCAAALHHHGVTVSGYHPGIHVLNEAEDPEGWDLSLLMTVGSLTVEQVFAASQVYRDVVTELDYNREGSHA